MAGPSVSQVLIGVVRAPHELLFARWHWKAAICSSLVRATLFAGLNAGAGTTAAMQAALTELASRGVASGVHGALTQALSGAEPRWASTITALVLLPLLGHGVEFVVHWAAGTARLGPSIAGSILFSVVSTLFNLHAMRHGALLVGHHRAASLRTDLRRMPALVATFLREPLRLWPR